MHKLLRALGHELREAVAPTLFFLATFHLLALTKALVLEEYQLTPVGAAISTVLALIVAKAVLIADKLPFIDSFHGRPLVWAVLWKSFVYAVLGCLFRILEELIPLLWRHEGLGEAFGHLAAEVSWPHFWAMQLWFAVALLTFCSWRELNRHLGHGQLRRAFLGGAGARERG